MGSREPRPGEDQRIPLEQAIALRFRYFSEFIEELSANFSMGGMFIRTLNPHPVASIFEFEFRLDEDSPLITGKAQVVWIRRHPDGPDRPPGMGVRFVELDDVTRQVIQRLIARHVDRGGLPFELTAGDPAGESPEAASGATVAAAGQAIVDAKPGAPTRELPMLAATRSRRPEPSAGAPRRPVGGHRRRWWRVAAALLALPLAAAIWWWIGDAPARQPQPTEPPGGAGAAVPAPAPAAAGAGAARPPAAATEPPPATPPDPAATVERWARAWSEQRVEDYLAAYSHDFEPPDGLTRPAWERQRRARILSPSWIKVGLAFLQVETAASDIRHVRFVQAYESDSYRDVVRKLLELRREPDGWRIVRESTEP